MAESASGKIKGEAPVGVRRAALQRRKRWNARFQAVIVPVLSLGTFALVWEVIARSGIVNPILLPAPSAVFQAFLDNIGPGDGDRPPYLFEWHTLTTFYRLLAGYLIAAVGCTALGLVIGISRTAYKWVNPIISFFMPIPSIALVPVAILWLGLGDWTVIFIVVVTSSFPIIYNTAAGVVGTNKKQIWAAQITGASRRQIFFKVLLPSAMPYIIAGQKLALGRAWRGVISGEIFASTKYGLGFMIFDARTFLATDMVFSGIVMVGIIGLVLEKVLFVQIERFTVERWGMVEAKHL